MEREPQDILAAMRDVMARMPDLDRVPAKIEMHPSLFRRFEMVQRREAPHGESPFDPYLPIEFDTRLPPSFVRVIYASGRKEIIVITPTP